MFGSNLGDRYGFLKKGLEMVSHSRELEILTTSGIYETEPVEIADQPAYLNAAVRISTLFAPMDLLTKLKTIETSVGRIPRGRWLEREIDIDIIFYGDEKIESEELTIPHPRAHLRRFVLRPLSEIASNFVHPIFHKTVGQLLHECKDTSAVIRTNKLLRMAN